MQVLRSRERLFDCAVIVELTVEGEDLSMDEAKELAARSLWAFVGRYSMPEVDLKVLCMEKPQR